MSYHNPSSYPADGSEEFSDGTGTVAVYSGQNTNIPCDTITSVVPDNGTMGTVDSMGRCAIVYESRPVDVPVPGNSVYESRPVPVPDVPVPGNSVVSTGRELQTENKQSHEEMAVEVLIGLSGNTENSTEKMYLPEPTRTEVPERPCEEPPAHLVETPSTPPKGAALIQSIDTTPTHSMGAAPTNPMNTTPTDHVGTTPTRPLEATQTTTPTRSMAATPVPTQVIRMLPHSQAGTSPEKVPQDDMVPVPVEKHKPLSWKDYSKSADRKYIKSQIIKELSSPTKEPAQSTVLYITPSKSVKRKLSTGCSPDAASKKTSPRQTSTIIHVAQEIDRQKWHTKFGKSKMNENPENPPTRKKPKPKINCQICGLAFFGEHSLIKHVNSAHKTYKHKDEYVNYLRTDYDRLCPLCGEMCATNAELQSHVLSEHMDDDDPTSCPLCDENKKFKSKQSVRQHIRSVHFKNFMQNRCEICDIYFTEKRTLDDHMNCTHNKSDQYPCDICDKPFLSKSRMRRHRLIHGDYRYFCPSCDKGFHVRDAMNKHSDLMHGSAGAAKRYVCNICGKVFNVKGNLKQHLLAVHMKTYSHKCTICDKGFHRQKTLDFHMQKEHNPNRKKFKAFFPLSLGKDIGPESAVDRLYEVEMDEEGGETAGDLFKKMTSGGQDEMSVAAKQIEELNSLPIEHISVDVPEPSQETTI